MKPNVWPVLRRAALLALLAAAACSTSPTIRSHVDPRADLSQFRTFGFYEGRQASYASFVARYIEDAVSDEMKSRGYQRSNAPDLLINFHLQTEQKVRVQTAPAYYGGWRVGYGWGGVPYETDVSSYKEGTLNVDVVDRARNELVWEGVAVGRLKSKAPDNPEPVIRAVVQQIFQQYPGRAAAGS